MRALGGVVVDTLRVGAYGYPLPKRMNDLRARLAEAKVLREGQPIPVLVLGGVLHEVLRGGTYPYSCSLKARDWTAQVATSQTGGGTSPIVMVTFRARALRREGWAALVAAFVRAFRELVEWAPVPLIVSRLDLAVDVEGYALEAGLLPRVTSRAATGSRAERWYAEGALVERGAGGAVVGYQLGSRGSRGLMCRMYRKDVQASQVPHAAWIRGVWASMGWLTLPVSRVEYELGREACKTLQVGTVDLLMREGAIERVWSYLVCEWCAVDAPFWGIIQAVTAAPPVSRFEQDETAGVPERLLRQAAGTWLSFLRESRLDAREGLALLLARAVERGAVVQGTHTAEWGDLEQLDLEEAVAGVGSLLGYGKTPGSDG